MISLSGTKGRISTNLTIDFKHCRFEFTNLGILLILCIPATDYINIGNFNFIVESKRLQNTRICKARGIARSNLGRLVLLVVIAIDVNEHLYPDFQSSRWFI